MSDRESSVPLGLWHQGTRDTHPSGLSDMIVCAPCALLQDHPEAEANWDESQLRGWCLVIVGGGRKRQKRRHADRCTALAKVLFINYGL